MKRSLLALSALAMVASAPAGLAGSIKSEDCLILPGETVEVGGTIPGLLSFVNIDIGDRVKKGQIIASLRSEVQEAALALAKVRAGNTAAVKAARARVDFESRELARTKTLNERGAMSQATVEEKQTSYEIRLRELEEAEMNLNLARLERERAEAELEIRRIRAPIDGVVADRFLDGGEYLRDDGKVVSVVDLDPLRVEVFLHQTAFKNVKPGDLANVKPELFPDERYVARVKAKDSVIDPGSATFRVRLELPNADEAIVSGIRCVAEF